jgi:ubiquinone/menaquinone biosynthesis C-methylase UbiE
VSERSEIGIAAPTAEAEAARTTGRSGVEHSPFVVSSEEGYELWAPTYDRDPNPLLALEQRTLRPLLPDLAGKHVLDVACGTGRWLAELISSGARGAIGVDRSPAMLEVAQTKAGIRGFLVKGDCLTLPFRSEVADVVICSFALGHISKLATFAREIARVARPLADVYVTDLHPRAYARGWRNGFRYERGSREIVVFAHSAQEVRSAFEWRGFKHVQSLAPHVGEPERGIFERAGKAVLFEEACGVPAVLIYHFQRADCRSAAR